MRELLERLIDHAPTFPPAQLPTAAALAADRRVRAGEEAWLVGRLVWPASRLDELSDLDDVPISLVLSGLDPVPGPGTRPVEAVEARWPALPGFDGDVFVEVPIDEDLERKLERVRGAGAMAKVRCGGERIPTNAELARFVRACAELELPFKASAGLHHALPTNGQHGFLNLLAAAAEPEDAEDRLADPDVARCLAPGHVPPGQLRARFRGFGSCSVAEPVAELRELGLL